jgi:hypothetical protein
LTKLFLEGCENLKERLWNIGSMSSLSILDLYFRKFIESPPTTIGDLKRLTKLLLQGCEKF